MKVSVLRRSRTQIEYCRQMIKQLKGRIQKTRKQIRGERNEYKKLVKGDASRAQLEAAVGRISTLQQQAIDLQEQKDSKKQQMHCYRNCNSSFYGGNQSQKFSDCVEACGTEQ